MANVRDDGQEPHIRLSPWASRHNTNEAHRFGGRVNAAFVHGKLTFLSGEICALRDRKFMREIRNGSIRLTNDPAYLSAVYGYESPQGETRNRQQLMSNLIAPCMETCGVSTQKSADGIVVPGIQNEGPNVEMSGASNELDVGVDSDRMSQTPARHGIAFPQSCLDGNSCIHCGFGFNPATAR